MGLQEFYQTLWQDVKDIFFNSLQESKRLKYLCTPQRQAIVMLLEKPNRDKRYVSNPYGTNPFAELEAKNYI